MVLSIYYSCPAGQRAANDARTPIERAFTVTTIALRPKENQRHVSSWLPFCLKHVYVQSQWELIIDWRHWIGYLCDFVLGPAMWDSSLRTTHINICSIWLNASAERHLPDSLDSIYILHSALIIWSILMSNENGAQTVRHIWHNTLTSIFHFLVFLQSTFSSYCNFYYFVFFFYLG